MKANGARPPLSSSLRLLTLWLTLLTRLLRSVLHPWLFRSLGSFVSPTNALRKITITETTISDTVLITTTTSTIATSTVPTSAGFTPIASEAGYVPKKRSVKEAAVPVIRGRYVEPRAATTSPLCSPIGKPGIFSQHPQTVTCGALIVAKTTTTIKYTATKPATITLSAITDTVTVSCPYILFHQETEKSNDSHCRLPLPSP